MKKISDIYEKLRGGRRQKLAVAAAADTDVLKSVAEARARGIVDAVLFGEEAAIRACLAEIGEDAACYELRPCENEQMAAQEAVRSVSSGECDILMKGLLPSGTFIREVLNAQYGLRKPGATLSSVAVLEITVEGETRLLHLTDPGFIPLPNLETKKQMIVNLTEKLRLLGYETPKIAALSAMETVNPKILSSVEAKELEEMNRRGEIEGCVVGGPFSMDLALSKASARHKGFEHPVAGCADAILVPSLEVGNAVLKSITYLVGCPSAGFVCGTTKPVVFTSRSDTSETKLNTIAMAALLAMAGE